MKLAAELARPDTGQTLYLLDEPTTGLHFDDLQKLLDVLHRLVDLGNTVVLIEHNLDVIKSCDWMIDMGPEAGAEGGLVVAAGTPEHVAGWATKAAKRRGGLRAHTGEALQEVLERGPLLERKAFDPNQWDAPRENEIEIEQVGDNVAMPWQTNGRQWHTQDRVGRMGQPCRWDGRILAAVVDRIHELGDFSETDWTQRTIVEIAATKKSQGWFFHAITGETWLLKMKFRVARGTFNGPELNARLKLATLNELHEVPLYSNEPRVMCRNARGPWQEVQINAYQWDEINSPAFWAFIERAVKAFSSASEHVAQNPEDVMPWKKLGRKWHLMRKGFNPGRQVQWPTELLDELFELLERVAPDAKFIWNNQVLVHMCLPSQEQNWCTIQTKKSEGVYVNLMGPRNSVALGRIARLGYERAVDPNSKSDIVRIGLRTLDELRDPDFSAFLAEHLQIVSGRSLAVTND